MVKILVMLMDIRLMVQDYFTILLEKIILRREARKRKREEEERSGKSPGDSGE